MSNGELAKTDPFAELLKKKIKTIEAIAPAHVNADRVVRIVLKQLAINPDLRACTPMSVFLCVLQATELGLEIGGASGEAYMVPFKDRKKNVTLCTFIPGYRGLIKLAYGSGLVKSVYAHCVYEGDEYELDMGVAQVLRHVPCGESDPSKIIHAYCVIKLMTGGVLFDSMTRAEIEKTRKVSRMSDRGAWVEFYGEQCKKTVTRRTQKYAPTSPDMAKALSLDNLAESGEPQATHFKYEEVIDAEIVDGPKPSRSDKLAEQTRPNGESDFDADSPDLVKDDDPPEEKFSEEQEAKA
ncbi:MAG: recombinase RecT [Armatimonadetes bacterium]|nr:recombinase RecT [Armatimonadota bacterium]